MPSASYAVPAKVGWNGKKQKGTRFAGLLLVLRQEVGCVEIRFQ